MADNKTKVDRIYDLLPAFYGAKTNPNWSALVEAVGESDQITADLIEEVRKQFFVKTASRPYLDRLAANYKIARPRFVGMSDQSFRQYIPILAYSPKQVKLIIDKLLDVFFFKESTTAFITSQLYEDFFLEDGWTLDYSVDDIYEEKISFKEEQFTDISSVSAKELAAAINRQAKYSYSTVYFDSINKKNYIRVFSKTIGSKGSIRIFGGRANATLRFNGFIQEAGNGTDTVWSVEKIGDTATFTHIGGTSPGIDKLEIGDIMVSGLPGNSGSFVIDGIDLPTNTITFKNLFATPSLGLTQTSANDIKFLRPNKYSAYLARRRAITWETKSGEITVEMPTSPPVVQRSLKGSFHINGAVSTMTNRDSDISLTLKDASEFPKSGSFWIEHVDSVSSRIVTDDIEESYQKNFNCRLIGTPQKYTYESRVILSTTGDIQAGSNKITNLVSVAGVSIGNTVFCSGIRGNARVVNIVGNIVTLDVAAIESATLTTVEFGDSTLKNISPNLPTLSEIREYDISSISRVSHVITVTTVLDHDFSVGELMNIRGSSGIETMSMTGNTSISVQQVAGLSSTVGVFVGQLVSGPGIPVGTKILSILSSSVVAIDKMATSTNIGGTYSFSDPTDGTFAIESIPNSNSVTFTKIGLDGVASSGKCTVERLELCNSGSKIILTDAISATDSRIKGPYIWDSSAAFVLSSEIATMQSSVQSGKIYRVLTISSDNSIEDGEGYIILDYGKENQEGPIRYLYKPSFNTLAIDPSYIFEKNHSVGGSVTKVGQRSPHVFDQKSGEYPPYLTDPSQARIILEDLISSVKSAGIFINFLVRYPDQLYSTLDVYKSGTDPG